MNSAVTSPHSLWEAVTQPREIAASLQGTEDTDVVVIGGGFTGLSATLSLARRGLKPVLLEARSIGWGASGRNNGQVIPTLSGVEPDMIVERYGDTGERFVQLIGSSASYLFDLVREEKIEAEAEQTGWIQPAHTPGRMKLCEQRVHAWSKFGFPARLMDSAAMEKSLGTDFWFGGMINPTGGHINPLALARGMAAAAERHGARIFEASPATAWTHDGCRWTVSTHAGSVQAQAMILATHAYTGEQVPGLAPRLARSVVPVLGLQVATEPLSRQLCTEILPDRQAVSDTRGDLRFFRYDARNRLVTGGALVAGWHAEKRMKSMASSRFSEAFPQLKAVRMDYTWSGFIGVTADRFPHVYNLGPDAWAWMGCNGRGVTLSVAIGDRLAGAALGMPTGDLGLPVRDLVPLPFHGFLRRLAPAYLTWMRLKDRLEYQL